MPTYTMTNINTGESREMILSLSEREELLATGEWKQELTTPGFVSDHMGTLKRAGDGWKEVLSRVKSGSSRNNTIHD